MIEQTSVRIRVLDEHVTNKIAAGEVVERPASVVKELVENALDAHATRVQVHVEKGGVQLVRVVDDGWGIEAADLAFAFAPHATSKLSDTDDLESIATLGFRGEALASIGAVSHASILSRVRGESRGFLVENRGGAVKGPRAAGAAPGTEVEVRNLFFNTPARARFLRTARTELGHIEDLVRRFALAYPEVGFRLTHDGKELERREPGEERLLRLQLLYGRELADSLLPVRGAGFSGYVSPPAVSRPNTREMHFYVNGRHIRDRILLRVVRDAYRDALHHGRSPIVFLFFDMDPAAIDINVHPTKAEIRWRDPRFLHAAVAPAITRALREADQAAGLDHESGVRSAMADFLRRSSEEPPTFVRETPPPGLGEAGEASGGAYSVFQVHDSYLVCEVADGIAIVDQHALHERVQYDRILRRLTAGGVEAQKLLVPEQVELAAADLGLLEEHRELLGRCGIEWSAFGGGTVALEAVPVAIPRERAGELLRDVLDLLRSRGREVDARTLFHDVADTMACKAAVRFGDRLSREEARALLDESGALDTAFVCPHGRPTVMRLTLGELERRFGRR